MTEAEWRSLVPEQPREGASYPVAPFLVSRIGNHHADVMEASIGLRLKSTPKPTLTLTVESASAEELRLRLDGTFRVVVAGEGTDETKAWGIIDYQALGCLRYDRTKKVFTRFDVAILGKGVPETSWVDRDKHNGQPLKDHIMMGGLFFELSAADSPFERIPPGRAAFGGLKQGQGGYWE
jgi:hypothetical protein